ncbi:unnamed protein product [Cuscuta epithymum]|uniref:Uncharacterized protein n=1 Tax=Cuscuta epithymum TaxID=186058 RepID=A0AAV0GBB8_9ASTE|nr:unnamed protein product [Cuscuta epithymum]
MPPYHLAATTPEIAYPLDKIISKGEWACLSDIIDLSEAGEPIRLDCFPSFVCNRVHTLTDIKDHTKKQELAGIFSYITHLVKKQDKHSLEGFHLQRVTKFLACCSKKSLQCLVFQNRRDSLLKKLISSSVMYLFLLSTLTTSELIRWT